MVNFMCRNYTPVFRFVKPISLYVKDFFLCGRHHTLHITCGSSSGDVCAQHLSGAIVFRSGLSPSTPGAALYVTLRSAQAERRVRMYLVSYAQRASPLTTICRPCRDSHLAAAGAGGGFAPIGIVQCLILGGLGTPEL